MFLMLLCLSGLHPGTAKNWAVNCYLEGILCPILTKAVGAEDIIVA